MSARTTALVALAPAVALLACAPAPVACGDGTLGAGGLCVVAPEDAGQSLPHPALDSGQLLPPSLGERGVCDEADADRWVSAHRSDELTAAVRACSLDPCAGGDCTFSGCLATALGLSSCETCIAHEIDCLLRACAERCGSGASGRGCASCLCAEGCGEVFDDCAGGGARTCALCADEDASCPRLLSAAVIIALVM